MRKNSAGRNDVLKLIAMVTMLIDHVGYMFFPEERIFRLIGRLAFPIFCYYLQAGFTHTRNFNAYARRVLFFAVLTQSMFALLHFLPFGSHDYNPIDFNILFLLFMGLYMLKLYEKFRATEGAKKLGFGFLLITLISLPNLASLYLHDIIMPFTGVSHGFRMDYGSYGLILILILYIYRDRPKSAFFAFFALSFFDGMFKETFNIPGVFDNISPFEYLSKSLSAMLTFSYPFFQFGAIFGMIVIYWLKDKEFALRIPKYFTYWFYPVHLLVLGIIDMFV